MAKHLHYGRHNMRSSDTVNLNTCQTCGTSNPTLPGQPPTEKCGGCGLQIPKPEPLPLPKSAFLRRPRASRIGMGHD